MSGYIRRYDEKRVLPAGEMESMSFSTMTMPKKITQPLLMSKSESCSSGDALKPTWKMMFKMLHNAAKIVNVSMVRSAFWRALL